MKYLLLTTFIAILAGAHSCFSEGKFEELKEIVESCFAKTEVSPEEQKRFFDADFILEDAEPNTFCFGKCFLEEYKIMKDGSLDEEAIINRFAVAYGEETLTEMIEECKGEQGDAECETEFKIFTCLNKNVRSNLQ